LAAELHPILYNALPVRTVRRCCRAAQGVAVSCHSIAGPALSTARYHVFASSTSVGGAMSIAGYSALARSYLWSSLPGGTLFALSAVGVFRTFRGCAGVACA